MSQLNGQLICQLNSCKEHQLNEVRGESWQSSLLVRLELFFVWRLEEKVTDKRRLKVMMKVVREVFNSHEKIYEAPDTGRKKQEGEERKKGK